VPICRKRKKKARKQNIQANSTQVDGIAGIYLDGTQAERFRLSVDVELVVERETKAGKACFFLDCRDAESMTGRLSVREWQWSRVRGRLKEGNKLTLDLRLPRDRGKVLSWR
jgi:hypothetical protein